MFNKDFKNWLSNGGTAPAGKADLGYFIGYAICKSYYLNANNKTAAIRKIIELNFSSKKKVHAFLERSGYPGWKD